MDLSSGERQRAENPDHIAIVGAGIAGLTAALALARGGLRVTLLDRLVEAPDVLRGEVIVPAGVHVLDRLGVGGSLRKVCREIHGLRVYHPGFVGRALHLDYDRIVFPRGCLKQTPVVALAGSRKAMHDALRHHIADIPGITFLPGAELQGLDRTASGWRLSLKDSRTIDADVVIGADGMGSRVRRLAGFAAPLERQTSTAMGFMAHQPGFASDHVFVVHHRLGTQYIFPFPDGYFRCFFEFLNAHRETVINAHRETVINAHRETVINAHRETDLNAHRETVLNAHRETDLGVYRETDLGVYRETDLGAHREAARNAHRVSARNAHQDSAAGPDAMASLKAIVEEALPEEFWRLHGSRRITPCSKLHVQRAHFMKPDHLVEDRLALIGDAAGCADPVTGLGMARGVWDAWELAQVLIDAQGDYRRERLRLYETQHNARVDVQERVTDVMARLFLHKDLEAQARSYGRFASLRWREPFVLMPTLVTQYSGFLLRRQPHRAALELELAWAAWRLRDNRPAPAISAPAPAISNPALPLSAPAPAISNPALPLSAPVPASERLEELSGPPEGRSLPRPSPPCDATLDEWTDQPDTHPYRIS